MRSKRDLVSAQHGGTEGGALITEYPWNVAPHLIPEEEDVDNAPKTIFGNPTNGRSGVINNRPPPGTKRGKHS